MTNKLKIGIIGCGAIGMKTAEYIVTELREKTELVGLYDKDPDKLSALKRIASGKIVTDLDGILKEADLIVEAASKEAVRDLIPRIVQYNKDLIVISVGAFVVYPEILEMTKQCKGNIYVPSGAIIGIDGLNSLRFGNVRSLTLTTAKPPRSLKGVKTADGEAVESVKEEKVLFEGDIMQAIKLFPRNINVAATIFLASRYENVKVIVKVNPALERNTHRIEIDAEEAKMRVEVENIPSKDNPRTSYLTILSIKSILQRITSNLKIGS
ncbi:MAG: aspartate dehydrogenase [Candidatus Omnitrophica bacterium]|nr:aspartate dehydrogenase [Candidatus Omnitrophota bacterium]